MINNIKLIFLAFCLAGFFSSISIASSQYFDDGEKFFKKKILKNQNFCLKKR